MLGDAIKWIDFVFFEVVCLIDFITKGKCFDNYPVLKPYSQRIQNLDGLKQYLEDPECIDRKYPFHNKYAVVGSIDKSINKAKAIEAY